MQIGLRVVLLWWSLASLASGQEIFPRPPELESAVAFWTRVYTEVDSNGGFLHDSRNLAVVYEALDFGAVSTSRQRSRIRDRAAEKYEAILRKLASGERGGLTTDEARVLAMWPAGTSDEEFARAAGRVRFQLGQADRYLAGLVRSGRWRSYIEQVLDDAGLPRELVAMPHVESSFDPTAYSRVGAAGMWQFTRSTGLRYMQIDHIVDERRDPFLSTRAAARLLKDNYDVIGSWPLAITAYNHGLGGMRRAVRTLGTDDIGHIVEEYDGRTFGFASRNFYAAFLAALDVDSNAEKYFGEVGIEPSIQSTVLVLPDYIDAAPLAGAFNLSLSQFRSLNPALMDTVWAGDKYIPRGFEVRLPALTGGTDPSALIAALPADLRSASQRPDLQHRVRPGDTLSQIADQYGISVSALVRANGLNNQNFIRVGQQLTLPVSGGGGDVVAAVAVEQETAAEPPRPTEPQPSREAVAAVQEAEESESLETPVEPEANLLASNQATLAADPSDYAVATDNTIEVQDMETLGHYADWLQIRTQRLRDINGMPFSQAVVVGRRIKLDFSEVDPALFEARRVAYQAERQESFFLAYQIEEIAEHVVSRGESLWILALREYDVPVWLLRQYNPDVDLDRVRPGTVIRFPKLRELQSDVG
ncbi:MAG TPA: LysM peptidoglycan-binding domain-containing protein [Gammaproteobacteria bacterium]|nr:LysM peptidoglycan-binding domain-containing protein [Gammaproteobacteria bacterium]